MTFSRRDTRVLLLQMLYADVFVKNLDISLWCESYHDELRTQNIDIKLLQDIREKIHHHISELSSIITLLAPKFSLEELPKIHTIILLISLAEMCYFSDIIPEKVSLNEAIELAKTFSDDAGAKFINGTLGNFVRDKQKYLYAPQKSASFFL